MSRSRKIQMKSIVWLGAALFTLVIAAPAPAQVTIQIGAPQVPGFSNYYPWFNDVPQYQGDQTFRWFLANHPNIARRTCTESGAALQRQLALAISGVGAVPGEPSLRVAGPEQ